MPDDDTSTPTRRPSNYAECGTCGASWTGHNRCHCGACHITLSGLKLFDRHRDRTGEHGRCLDPATIPGIELRDGVWGEPQMTDEAKAKAFGRSA